MAYDSRKRMAAALLKRSPKRVKLDPDELGEIKEALTKADLRGLIKDKVIKSVQKKGVSNSRAKQRKLKRSKGQRTGQGKRKGKATARHPGKEKWMSTVRLQRTYLRELKEKGYITVSTYRQMYAKSKGGFFRSKRHLSTYLKGHDLLLQKNEKNA